MADAFVIALRVLLKINAAIVEWLHFRLK